MVWFPEDVPQSPFFDRAGVSLKARPGSLGGDRGVVTATGVGRRGGTPGLWRVVHIVGVLVIAVDNRGEASQGIRSYPEVVVQVAVASAGDAALAHTTTMDFRGGLNLCEGAARLGRVLVLRHIYVPDGARWIVIGRVDTIVIGGAVPDDIEVPSAVGDAPGIDSCCRGGLTYLERSCPGRALVRGEAIVDVVIVAENGIDVASLVNAHVREIVIVADLRVGTVIHDVVGEGLATIGGNCHPDSMEGAGTSFTASYLARIVDTIEGLVDDMTLWVNHQVADLVVVDEEEMVGINGIAQLGERQSSIVATIDVDIEGRDIVIGDTDLRCSISRDPFPVIAGNGGTGWIEGPGLASVHAGADVNISQAQTSDVDVVDTG